MEGIGGVQSLSIIGVGAFGRLAFQHLKDHFDIILYDPLADLSAFANDAKIATSLIDTATSDIILLCVPVRAIKTLLDAIAPHLTDGQLVMDVGSVKSLPVKWMKDSLPDGVNIVATHPVFGPESGKNGIKGQNISIMNVRGNVFDKVSNFLSGALKLNVIHTNVDQHDKEMAYVQGLTHLIAKILKNMDVPELQQTTRTYNHLLSMVDMIKNDSPELFHSIQTDNPYVEAVKADFFEQVKLLEKSLHQGESA